MLLGSGLFTALLSLILVWGVVRSFVLAYWLAAAQAALMLLGVVTESFASGWAAVSATAGGLTALAGLAALAAAAQLRSHGAEPRTIKLRWATVIRVILVIHLVAMLGWVANYAILTMMAGLIGFQDFWTVPVGIAAVVALVIAGVTYRPGSSGTRLAAAGGLAASSAALLYSLQSGQSPVTQVIIVALVLLAVAGIVLVTLEGQPATPRGMSAR